MLNDFEITVIGNVGRDAELRQAVGKPVCSYSVAVRMGKEKTSWVKVTTWGKQAELDAQYVKSGMKVIVRGVPQTDDKGLPRTYEKDGVVKSSGYEITGYDVKYLTKVEVGEAAVVNSSSVVDEPIPF